MVRIWYLKEGCPRTRVPALGLTCVRLFSAPRSGHQRIMHACGSGATPLGNGVARRRAADAAPRQPQARLRRGHPDRRAAVGVVGAAPAAPRRVVGRVLVRPLDDRHGAVGVLDGGPQAVLHRFVERSAAPTATAPSSPKSPLRRRLVNSVFESRDRMTATESVHADTSVPAAPSVPSADSVTPADSAPSPIAPEPRWRSRALRGGPCGATVLGPLLLLAWLARRRSCSPCIFTSNAAASEAAPFAVAPLPPPHRPQGRTGPSTRDSGG